MDELLPPGVRPVPQPCPRDQDCVDILCPFQHRLIAVEVIDPAAVVNPPMQRNPYDPTPASSTRHRITVPSKVLANTDGKREFYRMISMNGPHQYIAPLMVCSDPACRQRATTDRGELLDPRPASRWPCPGVHLLVDVALAFPPSYRMGGMMQQAAGAQLRLVPPEEEVTHWEITDVRVMTGTLPTLRPPPAQPFLHHHHHIAPPEPLHPVRVTPWETIVPHHPRRLQFHVPRHHQQRFRDDDDDDDDDDDGIISFPSDDEGEEAFRRLMQMEALMRTRNFQQQNDQQRRNQNSRKPPAVDPIPYRDRITDCFLCCADGVAGGECSSCHAKICGGCVSNFIITNWAGKDQENPQSATKSRGRVPCPSCTSAHYSMAALQRLLTPMAMEQYVGIQVTLKEADAFQKSQEIVEGFLRGLVESKQLAAMVALPDALVQEHLKRLVWNAYQCPKCNYGPILKYGCDDLMQHHGEAVQPQDPFGGGMFGAPRRQAPAGAVSYSNACPGCGFVPKTVKELKEWDGEVREKKMPAESGQPASGSAAAPATTPAPSMTSSARNARIMQRGRGGNVATNSGRGSNTTARSFVDPFT